MLKRSELELDVKTIEGIHKLHSFVPRSNREIEVKRHSECESCKIVGLKKRYVQIEDCNIY